MVYGGPLRTHHASKADVHAATGKREPCVEESDVHEALKVKQTA